MTAMPKQENHRLGWMLAAITGALLFAAFVNWGGVPTDQRAGIFWAQMVALFIVTAAFALLFWHLLLRSLAPNLRMPKADHLPRELLGRIALLQAGGIVAIFVGANWDEVWHRHYGIPFGEDFFWRPHLLIYFGIIVSIGIGFWALRYLNRRLKGSFQQRFRSNRLVGLLILNAAFMLYALTSDPLWHWTFGEDLTAWSVPHLIMLTSFVLTITIAAFAHMSAVGTSAWRTIASLRYADAVPLLLFAAGLLIWLQLMMIDWDGTLLGVQPESLGMYRPEWLLAANLLACATFTGVMATRLMRCAGAATAAGLLALAIRFTLIQLFDTDLLQIVAWQAALLPLFAVDLWAFYCSALRKSAMDWRGSAAVLIAAMALNVFVIRELYNLQTSDNLTYALAVILTAIGMSWLSHQVADALARHIPAQAERGAASTLVKPQFSFGVLGAFLVFIVIFITTAAPPV